MERARICTQVCLAPEPQHASSGWRPWAQLGLIKVSRPTILICLGLRDFLRCGMFRAKTGKPSLTIWATLTMGATDFNNLGYGFFSLQISNIFENIIESISGGLTEKLLHLISPLDLGYWCNKHPTPIANMSFQGPGVASKNESEHYINVSKAL